MKKVIVTTTIQPPTEATIKFSQKKDWKLIVVGDKKTPHKAYENLDCIYLPPELQEDLYPKLSPLLGWNTIQRRNIGFVYAYNLGADIIATVDDDNVPYESWGQNVFVNQEIEVCVWVSKNQVFDPLSVTNYSDLWHRGYPIDLVKTKNDVYFYGKKKRKVLVQADLWDGDPDIDAMCRIPHKPECKFSVSSPFASLNISPFNSQNTFLSRKVLPYYMVLPYVGRMDDIWGGYMLFQHFKDFLIYGPASVYQYRNMQDLIKNLENEIIGYRNTQKFLDGDMLVLPSKTVEAYEAYQDEFVGV